MSNRIVVVGGGFAGFWAAVAARRVAPTDVDVVLVSRTPLLQMRPRLYEAEPQTLQIDLLPLLERVGVDFIRCEATALDHVARKLLLADGGQISYARLVVATGSVMRRPPLPGADEAYSIDTVREALAFDRRLAEIVRGGGGVPVLAVVGAGFTGIELVLELRDRIAHHGTPEQAERARIVLVDRADVVGPELGAGPRPLIEAALADARVDLILGACVTALGGDRIVLADGETLRADAVILTTGMVAAEFVRNIPGEHDELGRIVVDRGLRVPAARDIFVAGDAAAADGHGQMVLQSCQHALQLGRYAGENAARDLIGLPTIPYLQPPYITCLDLGRSGAVFTRGWERKVELTGAEAKAVKRRINTGVIYPPHDATREELLALSNLDLALQRWPPAQAGLGTDVTVRSGSMSQSAQRPMATTNRQLPRRSPVARLRRALRDR